MEAAELEKLKYPIGKFHLEESISEELRLEWINSIESFHSRIKRLVEDLPDEKRLWKYRPGGWNIAQLVHHCADSHINSLVRFKWALTEDEPTIKPYYEERWIELGDASTLDFTDSLALIHSLHKKWVSLLKSLDSLQLQRTYIHPESQKPRTVEETIGSYAWHCEHHLAHVQQALEAEGAYNQ